MDEQAACRGLERRSALEVGAGGVVEGGIGEQGAVHDVGQDLGGLPIAGEGALGQEISRWHGTRRIGPAPGRAQPRHRRTCSARHLSECADEFADDDGARSEVRGQQSRGLEGVTATADHGEQRGAVDAGQ